MNKYEVLGLIGEGTYGIVLKCRCKESGEIVAIKKFKETEANDDTLRKTTMREVEMLKRLKQDNIIQLKETFRRKGKLHLVFEYYEKNLLEALQTRSTRLPPELVRVYMYQLVCAINYCHENNVIHRDIKPENLLINPDHSLKLCDFGFARYAPRSGDTGNYDPPLTDYVATRWYRSPELLVGCNDYGFPVDIWSMGCIMGELIDGSPLFPGETEIDQLYIIQKIQGPLTSDQNVMFFRNPNFKGFKFPDMSTPKDTLEKRYAGMLSPSGFSFLRGLLAMDPRQRLTGRQCLEHEYFRGLDLDMFRKDQIDYPQYIDQPIPQEKTKNNVGRSKSQMKQFPTLVPSSRANIPPKDIHTPRSERRNIKQSISNEPFSQQDVRSERKHKKIKEPRFKSPPDESDRCEKGERRKDKKKRKSKPTDDTFDTTRSHRNTDNREQTIENFVKIFHPKEGKENKEKLFVKPARKNRSKSKAGYYSHSSKNTPRVLSKTPDYYTAVNEEDKQVFNTMNQIGNIRQYPPTKTPNHVDESYHSKLAHIAQELTLMKATTRDSPNPYYANLIADDEIEAISLNSLQSPREQTPVYSARRKRQQATNQMHLFSPNTQSAAQQHTVVSKQIDTVAFNKQLPQQRLTSATLTRSGSSTGMIQKPLPKLNSNMDLPVTPQQTPKPPTRKGARAKNQQQNFMTQLHDRQGFQHIYQTPHVDLRPSATALLNSELSSVTTPFSTSKPFHALGAAVVEAGSGRGYW